MKRNNALVIGVTGGVGSGKSTALNILKDKYNGFIIKADDLGNEVKLKGHVCFEPLLELLGKEVLDENGEIDKKIMAQMIFTDEELLFEVNSIIHPAVRSEIESLIEKNKKNFDYIFTEAALLCEADYFPIINALFEVRTDKDIRIKRLMDNRCYSLTKCEEIISNQSDVSFYKESSDLYEMNSERTDYYGYFCIKNNKDEDDLIRQIESVMEELNERIR